MHTTDLQGIKIQEFIFHVVHHNEDNPILLDEAEIGKYELFFKERIKEVLNGNKFYFNPESQFLKDIQAIDNEEKSFLEISKNLAKKFHSIQDDRIKPGVMILIKAQIDQNSQYILIKYDHENIIYYKKQNNKAILDELSDTFSKSKEALQKSAIIYLDKTDPFVVVVDKSERDHITKFFKSFLGIKRFYTEKILTEKVRECYLTVVKTNKELFPSNYTSQCQHLFYDLIQKEEHFNLESFSSKIFGTHNTPDLQRTLEKELKKKDILGEEFKFDKAIKRPQIRKLRTKEGVSIQYTDNADDTVKIDHTKSKTVITITTTQLIEE